MADQGSEGLLSPFLRIQRIQAVRPYLSGCVLDFGCGSGALAAYVEPDKYIGFDRDEECLRLAERRFAEHRFESSFDKLKGKTFETVVALAVIEHVEDTIGFLCLLKSFLALNSGSKLVCTTPHPSMDKLHTIGTRVGLFSSHASEEHHDLLDCHALGDAGNRAGLQIVYYKRFLMGANQIIIFKHKH